jgi:hypothetical protein
LAGAQTAGGKVLGRLDSVFHILVGIKAFASQRFRFHEEAEFQQVVTRPTL